MLKKVYLVNNLDCAHCAAKIEEKIGKLPQVQEVSLTFATKQLRITAEDPDGLLPEILKIAKSVEHDVEISPREEKNHHEHHHYEEGEDCCCGHDHEHHHHEEDEDCCCGHDHHHHHSHGESVKQVFLIENLDCAHCAAKIESKIAALPEVQEASITFSTKQLRVTAEDPEALLVFWRRWAGR